MTVKGKGHNNYITITGAENVALIGAVDSDGRPATRLDRHVELNNDASPYYNLSISDSRKISIKNLVLANNPPLGSTARVIDVNRGKDEITVEEEAELEDQVLEE